MNRRAQLARQQLEIAQQKLQAQHVPQGAYRGAIAGQEAMAQQGQGIHPFVAQQMMAMGMVPPGAEAGLLAACGAGPGCMGPIASPFAAVPQANIAPWVQPATLLGIVIQAANFNPISVAVSCGNTFFHGCCARSFTPENQVIISSIVSGFNTTNRLCPDSGIDIGYFRTDECCCPFDFGCFSNLAPLEMTFDPIDNVSSVPPLINMVIGGSRLSYFNECWPFPPGPGVLPPGVPGIPGQYGAIPGTMPPQIPAV